MDAVSESPGEVDQAFDIRYIVDEPYLDAVRESPCEGDQASYIN